MRIGIGIGEIGGTPATVDGLIGQAKQAEADGFASGWFANIFGFDAILACALAGRETSTIELGTAVTPSYPRHPTAMAQQAISANAACSGRFALGIGLSHQIVIENMLGLSYAKPYSHMKEYVEVLNPLLRGEAVGHQGDEFKIMAQIQVAGAPAPSLLIAALAPKMLALAGRETAGTITWMTATKTLKDYTVPRITEAAAAAGRPAPRVVCGLPIAVCNDPKGAREKAGKAFEIYGTLPSYRAMLDREGAAGPGDVAIVGDESDVGEQLDRLAEAGVTDYLAAPFSADGAGPESLERTRAFLIKRAKG
ncbi:MAG: TIGR03564 family F420-dependent LLM class oxidoreductase [Candidatus Binatia bacterium]|nr:TIGR03564 family F420-dependent LLM class oxidoreductase [Candidatus Binatia bacterium]